MDSYTTCNSAPQRGVAIKDFRATQGYTKTWKVFSGNAIFDCWVRGFKLPGHLPIPQNLLEHPLWSLNKLNNSNLLNLKLKQNQVK